MYFQSKLVINRQDSESKCFNNEYDAIVFRYALEQKYYNDYNYNFLLDRVIDLDILDLERTGQISEEEAIYRHVLRYADNA